MNWNSLLPFLVPEKYVVRKYKMQNGRKSQEGTEQPSWAVSGKLTGKAGQLVLKERLDTVKNRQWE